jgi:protein-tyrosine phosphatase
MHIDSAGTHVRGAGGPADPRGLVAALARGYNNSELRARQIAQSDFSEHDLILAMDSANLADLQQACPADTTCKIRLFDPQGRDVPDPYDGGPADYEHALDMIEHAADALLDVVKK